MKIRCFCVTEGRRDLDDCVGASPGRNTSAGGTGRFDGGKGRTWRSEVI